MKTLKSLCKKNYFNSCGYIYRNGINLIVKKRLQKGLMTETEFSYFLPIEITLPKNVNRVIVHYPSELFPFGIPWRIQLHENQFSSTENEKLKTMNMRTVQFEYNNTGKLLFDQWDFDGDNYYNNSSITN